ncbi:MAG: AAA family ATPase [Candidatus Eisenbacteria bacterium]|nr:AAA family ATPase [Candidatus Eisenbacteria bacterium]
MEVVRGGDADVRRAYESAQSSAAEYMGAWRGTPYLRGKEIEVSEAIFDSAKLDRLLASGLRQRPPKGGPGAETAPAVWWVNQKVRRESDEGGGFLWAPLTTKAGHRVYHWDTMDDLRVGDVVLHYTGGHLRFASRVTESSFPAQRPREVSGEEWGDDGRIARVEYHEVDPPIPIEVIAGACSGIAIENGPFTTTGGVKQGYLFKFTTDALAAIASSTPATNWPAILSALLPQENIHEVNPPYSLAECAEETGFDEARLERWVRAIKRKKQAVFYGSPGTGKTYIAERLARHLIGDGDGFWELVQFHPAYSYEDFMQGIRPKTGEDGRLEYPLESGRFLQFCDKARQRSGICVLIVDEINRANLARVLGELMYLLEYRDRSIPLAGGRTLEIPENVRIIGTMNTADRSIALVDHALRRRFAFLALSPEYEVLRRFHVREETGFDVAPLIRVLERLNRQIGDPHYSVGISYFLQDDLAFQIEDIWRMEIEPYLEEYFFDQPDKVAEFRWERVGGEILGA